MRPDTNENTPAAVAARRRADDARRRAVAAREAAEQARTEYARLAHHRVADLHTELAFTHENLARTLGSVDGDPPGADVRSVETVRLDVESRMRRGERFSDVEDIIEASDLSAQAKSALWLLGWSYVHPRAQRREANAHLAQLPAATPPPPLPSHAGRHLHVAG